MFIFAQLSARQIFKHNLVQELCQYFVCPDVSQYSMWLSQLDNPQICNFPSWLQQPLCRCLWSRFWISWWIILCEFFFYPSFFALLMIPCTSLLLNELMSKRVIDLLLIKIWWFYNAIAIWNAINNVLF